MNEAHHLDDQQLRLLLESAVEEIEDAATQHIGECETCQARLSKIADADELAGRLDQLKSHSGEMPLSGDRPAVLDRLKDEFISHVTSEGQTWARQDAFEETSIGATPPPPDATHRKAAPREMPSRLGRYEIERAVGKGGQATVYRAYDTEMERHVALKVPQTSNWDFQGGKKRFYKEVKAASRLDHPNICRNLDVGEIDGIAYLTMSFIEGRTLGHWAAGDRSLGDTLLVVERIAKGLVAAHKAGVVHRDLKPGNIMVKGDNEPVIMDFGLAHRIDSADDRLTITGTVVGTPLYMSPEQVTGKHKEIGPATDLYSLGVILYELLTGKAPYEGNMESVFGQILHSPPPVPSRERSDLPAELDQLCQRAMAKQPAERFASADEFAAAIAAVRESIAEPRSATTVVSTAVDPRAKEPAANYWTLFGGVTVIGLVALAIAGYANDWFVQRVDDLPVQPSVVAENNSPQEPIVPAGVGPTDQSAADPGENEPVAAALGSGALTVSAEVHLQRAAQKSGYAVLASDLLPLRDFDKLQFHVNVSEPAYIYLWWYDAKGKPLRLQPADGHAVAASDLAEPPNAAAGEKQQWHVMGDDFGYEMLLAAVSRKPLSEAELNAVERVRLRFAEQSSGGQLLALTRGLIGTVESEKGERTSADEPVSEALLVLPEDRLGELIVVSPDTIDRGLIGTVSSVKGKLIGETETSDMLDLKDLLENRFDSYYGLVVRHEE